MSKLKSFTGEDFPDAASKHLHDAGVLLAANRHDNAAYLLGYVVECFFKTLLLIEGESPKRIHGFQDLAQSLRAISLSKGVKTLRYRKGLVSLMPTDPPPAGWHPSLRYLPVNSVKVADAKQWFENVKNKIPSLLQRMKTEGHI